MKICQSLGADAVSFIKFWSTGWIRLMGDEADVIGILGITVQLDLKSVHHA